MRRHAIGEHVMDKLAMFGGARSVTPDPGRTAWPVVTDAEREAVLGILDRGGFTSVGSGAGVVRALEEEWAAFTGTSHCVAVASGTAAIEVALAAAGLDPGAEILVPALTFVGSAVAPVQRLLVPVFVDVQAYSFNIDPAAAAAAITPRTQAILAVHLHGLPCDMAELRALATRRGLLLVEDAAQAHAATYRGRMTGGLGDVAAFSLNPSKNLPTCGEGGLITTDDQALHEQAVRYRQFGEDITAGPRRYLSRFLAGNAKLSSIEAAFARCQLDRLADRHAERDKNVTAFLDRLSALPGVTVPSCPTDRTHAWHILRLRFSPAATGHPNVAPGALRSILQRALRMEGVPVARYQEVPLSGQPAFTDQAGFGGYPWKLPDVPERRYRSEDHPVAAEVIEDSLAFERWHLNPAGGPVLERCAEAFEKVWGHMGELARIAGSMSYEPGRPS